MKAEALTYGAFYHIYNRGNNSCNLFREEENYRRFLYLIERYISPIADTYAWVLMPNHFHLLVRIKEDIVYRYRSDDSSIDAVSFEEKKWETMNRSACGSAENVRVPIPHLHFSHLFSAYSKYINKRYNRTGTLFERPFRRKRIDHVAYLKNVIIYIHQNPVHHGFCTHPLEYAWSSYLTCTVTKPSRLQRQQVLDWFDAAEAFEQAHRQMQEYRQMSDWLNVEPDYYTPAEPGTTAKYN